MDTGYNGRQGRSAPASIIYNFIRLFDSRSAPEATGSRCARSAYRSMTRNNREVAAHADCLYNHANPYRPVFFCSISVLPVDLRHST
jgi:hypothetical protein